MRSKRIIALFIGLGLGLGGGFIYLDSQNIVGHQPTQVVGSLGPGVKDPAATGGGSVWPVNWVSTGGGPEDTARIMVTHKAPSSQTLDFKLPGFFQESVLVGGRTCSRISVPGLVKIQKEGLPELPVLATNLIVPADGVTRVKIIEHIVREIKMDPVEPSVGYVSRNVDPSTIIPNFSDFYKSDEVWPKEPVEVSPPFTVREYAGVNVRFNPLRYHAGKGLLLVSERLVVDIVTEGGFEKQLTFTNGDDLGGAGYSRVYHRFFSNYTETAGPDKYQQLQPRGRMLIVSHDAFAGYLDDFMTWKRQRGIDVTLMTVGEIGGTAATIGQAIQTMYEESGGLAWVILVGDIEQVPAQVGLFDGSISDSRYAMVAGNDIYPDLFISRISARNSTEVQTQVNRFVSYEKNPDTGADAGWYSTGVGVASDEGSPADFKRADYLRTDLLGYGFQKVEQIYQGFGGSTTGIRTALENGCSVINYLGHASGYAWTSVSFSTANVRSLDNSGRWPWIIDVACFNGNFELGECFAEAWLRAGTPDKPDGAVAMIGASSLAPWVPPTVMQAEVIDLLVADRANTIGSLYYSGLMRVLDNYAGQRVATQVMEQNVIFGDCSLMVRTRAPEEFIVDQISAVAVEGGTWTIDLLGPAGSVVALTSEGILHGAAVVDAAGRAVVELTTPPGDRSSLTVTISGYNMVPYIDSVVVSSDGGGIIIPEPEPEPEAVPSTKVTLVGNYPNPFNPSTRIVFELPRDMRVNLAVYDVRGSLVRVLVQENMPAGRQEVFWDGCNTSGRNVASGVYLYQLGTPDGNHSGRMLLAK